MGEFRIGQGKDTGGGVGVDREKWWERTHRNLNSPTRNPRPTSHQGVGTLLNIVCEFGFTERWGKTRNVGPKYSRLQKHPRVSTTKNLIGSTIEDCLGGGREGDQQEKSSFFSGRSLFSCLGAWVREVNRGRLALSMEKMGGEGGLLWAA